MCIYAVDICSDTNVFRVEYVYRYSRYRHCGVCMYIDTVDVDTAECVYRYSTYRHCGVCMYA